MAITGTPTYSFGHTTFGLHCGKSTWSAANEPVAKERSHSSDSTTAKYMNSHSHKGSKAVCGRHLTVRTFHKILDCLNELQKRKALCPRHESVVFVSQLTSTEIPSYTGGGDNLEKRYLGVLHQLEQIYHCPSCRNLLKKNDGLSCQNEDFVHQKRLFLRLIKQCLGSTDNELKDTLEGNSYTMRLSNLPSENCPLGSVDDSIMKERHSRPLDKSQYCWEWLLCSVDETDETDCSDYLHEFGPDKHRAVFMNHSNLCPSWSGCDTASQSAGSMPLRIEINCDDNIVSRFLLQSPDCRRPRRFPERNELISKGQAVPQANRCSRRQLPHRVSRQPEKRMRTKPKPSICEHYSAEVTSSNTFPNGQGDELVHTGCRRTPWFATPRECKFDHQLWSAFSSMNLCSSTEEEDRFRRNSQTLDFLSSLSPTLNIIPPPNHNPFAKNESV
ncbi:hypothetical protein T265_04355 [Opisthorchis viverrini]|uniref:Uncharacterized protein n=1 Tax=Opisthorchis viverrini TaxID=6198 RepID=A0A074ZZZ7_OPIVI|nr:hypothetical protein T265_04355 [Opisthorchis viverrini]KER28885.1 hypothetical protein T265_04355 [Opisthorchis viverrini]